MPDIEGGGDSQLLLILGVFNRSGGILRTFGYVLVSSARTAQVNGLRVDVHLQLSSELFFADVYPVTGGVSGYYSRNRHSPILNQVPKFSRVRWQQVLILKGLS